MNKINKVNIILQYNCPLCRQKEYLKKIKNVSVKASKIKYTKNAKIINYKDIKDIKFII